MDEPAFLMEASFQENAVKVGQDPQGGPLHRRAKSPAEEQAITAAPWILLPAPALCAPCITR
jgi:hypothetical protein